jgi:hypothetical protein
MRLRRVRAGVLGRNAEEADRFGGCAHAASRFTGTVQSAGR